MLQRGGPAGLSRDVVFWRGRGVRTHGCRVARRRRAQALRGRRAASAARDRPAATGVVDHGRRPQRRRGHRLSALSRRRAGRCRAEWGEAGLTLALLGTGDWTAARDAAAPLEARKSPLAMPLRLRLVQGAVDSSTPVDIGPIVQELLGGDPRRRCAAGSCWSRARSIGPTATATRHARSSSWPAPWAPERPGRRGGVSPGPHQLRAARIPAGAERSRLAGLGAAARRSAHRRAAILQGEAAYQSGDHAAAGGAFRRVLLEFPAAPQASMVRIWPWRGRRCVRAGARPPAASSSSSPRTAPDSPYAVDALVLAAELATEAGDLEAAGRLLEQIVTTYPTQPAHRLRRDSIAASCSCAPATQRRAQTALRDWLGRASFPALFRSRPRRASAPRCSAAAIRSGAQREFTLAAARRHGPVREPRPGRRGDEPQPLGRRRQELHRGA
mgnify:CR=1 FL=1